MTPRYETPRVRLYEGSADDVLATLMEELLARTDGLVVLTDPPYWHWAHICEATDREHLDLRKETLWMGDVLMMTLAWLPMVRALRPGIAWFFAEPHYAAIYMRVARYLKWPMVGWWSTLNVEHTEYLIAFSDDDLVSTAFLHRQIAAALQDNTYGQAKSADMLERILRVSPQGIAFDPFCGTGTTLVAAVADGRQAIGIEMDGQIAAKAEALLRSVA